MLLMANFRAIERTPPVGSQGIAVILDVVYNHISPSSNYLYYYLGVGGAQNIYFDTPPSDTPWGPQLDLDRQRVRDFVLDAVVMMLDEYRLDGFRVDAVSALTAGPQPGRRPTGRRARRARARRLPRRAPSSR